MEFERAAVVEILINPSWGDIGTEEKVRETLVSSIFVGSR